MGWQDHAPAAGGAGDGSRSWRQPTSGQPAPEPRRNSVVTKARGKQFFASSLAVGCAVVLIWLLMLFIKGCDNAQLFVTTTLEYEGGKAGAIPPNWMGDADRKRLQWLEESRRVRNLKVTSFSKELDFQKSLKDLFAGKDLAQKKDTACLVYLSAHAVAGPFLDDSPKSTRPVVESDVLLLTKDDDLVSKSNRLRLSEILNALKHLPKEQRKLLLLDLSHLQGRWRLGIYDNFVIEAIQSAVEREKIQNLFVITACSSGETSWVSPHLGDSGQSVFAHFVARGLAGEADQTNDKSDGSITVSELFRFVHTRVNDWVERNRDPAGQHPRLFASDGDAEKKLIEAKTDTTFSVALINTRSRVESKKPKQSDAPAVETVDKAIDQLLELWKRRQTLEQPTRSAIAIYHSAPVRFRALTHRLMRAEEYLLHHHVANAAKEIKEAESLCQGLESHAKQGNFAAANFAADEIFPRRLADRFGLGAAPRTEGAAAPPGTQDAMSLALPDEHLATVLSRAHKQHTMPLALKGSDSDAVQSALVELRRLAESVAFGHHTVLPWLRQDLKDADQLRRRAEDSFFVVDTASARQKRDKPKKGETVAAVDQSVAKAQEVRQFIAEATQSFERLRDRATTLENAQFALNRACATLPEWLAFVSDRSTNVELRKTRNAIMNRYHEPLDDRKNEVPKSDILDTVDLISGDDRSNSLNQLDREILAAALEAIKLRRLLPKQFDSVEPSQLPALKLSTKDLIESFEQIQKRFQREADNLRNTSQPQPSHWRVFRDLLRCSTLDPETRRDLFGKLIHLRLTEDTSHNTIIKMPEPNDHQTANWQMLCTLHALSLVPAPTDLASDKLWNEWHDLSIKDDRVEPESVIKLSRHLRNHWIGHLAEARADCRASQQESRESARNCLQQKDQSARLLFASDAINLEKEPTRRFEEFLIAELLLDSSERYLDDFWNQWYEDAAKTCLAKAAQLVPKLLDEDRSRVDTLLADRVKSELLLETAAVEFGLQPTAIGSIRVKSDTNLPRGLATTWLSYKDDDARASKSRPLAERCFPRSVGLEVAHKTASNDVSRFEIAQPDAQALTTSGGCKASQVVPQVFFRDHTWSAKQKPVAFNPCRPDGTLIRHLAAASTGAIRVTGKERRSVVFVLDASLSMIPEGNEKGEDRWTDAKRILRNELQQMLAGIGKDANAGRNVQLMIFGHKNPTNKNDRDYIQTELPMTPLEQATVDRTRIVLEQITPVGNTPLMTAIVRACESLEKSQEPATVVAITDGVPSEGILKPDGTPASFAEYKAEQQRLHEQIRKAISRSLKESRRIELQIIGLGFGDKLPANATDNEKGSFDAQKLLEGFMQGQQSPVLRAKAGVQQLQGLLKLTTELPSFHVVPEGAQPPNMGGSASLGKSAEGLVAGKYRIGFPTPDRLKEGLIHLRGDELLDLEMLPDGELKHIHPRRLNDPVAFRATMDNRRFDFGYLESFRADNGSAKFLIGIQDRTSGSNRQAPYTERPERLILEVFPNRETLTKVRPMIYQVKPGESDPTWNIQIDELPQQVSDAEIKAYANWDPVPPDGILEASTSPQSVSVPIDKTNKIAFQVVIETPANDRVDLQDSVQVKLTLSNPADAAPLEKEWRHLAYLHVQLRLDGKPIPHLNETAEVITSANEIRWRFSNLPKEVFSAKRLRIAVTSWHTFQLHALPLEKPLLIKAE